MRISDWSSDVCSSDLLFQRIDMGGGEVADMDIVAHPGSVGRVVIGAVDGDVAALADRGLYGDLDQMRGTGGGLAGATLRIGAGDVEIAQRAEVNRMGGGRIGQHPLGHQLRPAIDRKRTRLNSS